MQEYIKNNKETIYANHKEWSVNNKEETSAYYRKKRYNLSPEDYDTMLEEQDNKCKICLVKFSDVTPNVDHCHTTNKVRGILCTRCNTGLGQFRDDAETLTKAINYLEEYNEPIK
jgi:nitrate/TMAO reductase-like tetraheme cytochrome c subunit